MSTALKMVHTASFGVLLRDTLAQMEDEARDTGDDTNDVLERLRLDALQSVLASEGGRLQRPGFRVYSKPAELTVTEGQQQLDVRY